MRADVVTPHSMTPEELGALRERLGMSIEQFALALAVDVPTAKRWESGVSLIAADDVAKIVRLARERDR